MSEKRLDAKNRWRNVVVAFRMSAEEAQELNVKVSLSGLSKQDYIIQCLLKHEIKVVGGIKVAKKVQVHLDTILEELQTLDESDRGIEVEELLVPLKHVLDILAGLSGGYQSLVVMRILVILLRLIYSDLILLMLVGAYGCSRM